MNYYISAILKIILLEASAALLLIDLVVAKTRGKDGAEPFLSTRERAAAWLGGLMTFAWANYGLPRGGNSVPFVLTVIPLILLCAWLVRAGFDEKPTDLMQGFRDTASKLHPTHGPRVMAVALSAALAFGWVGQGVRTHAIVMVHQWEQFHFYLGAKYQKELGWFDLYKAAIVADRESAHVLDNLQTTRELTTFDDVPVSTAVNDEVARRIHERFGPEQWENFKADWVRFTQVFPIDWARVMDDHGNSNSPAWAIIAHPLAKLVPISVEGNTWLAWLDMLLMLAMWLMIFHTFGTRVGATALLCWAMMPLVFDYLSGSFLRWDWLFAMGFSVSFLQRKKYATAGAFFGYAVATKLFPIFFGVALGIRAFFTWRKTNTFSNDYRRFLMGTVVVGGLSVVISAIMFGPSSWLEYAQRIQVAQVEKFYAIQYSLKTVFLQFAAGSPAVWVQGLFPAELMQARADVDIKDYAVGFLVARVLFTLLVAQLIRRADDVEAFTLGPLLVFTWLTVNMYYWNMLGLLALGLMLRRHKSRGSLALLLGLHATMMFFYLYQHFNRGFTEGFAVAVLIVLITLIGGALEWKDRAQPA